MLGIFSDRPVGQREDCQVKRDGGIAGDVECQNIAPGDREFISQHAGETLNFGRNLFGILVTIAIAQFAGLRDFPVIGLDARLTVFADHHKLGQRSFALLINEHFSIAQFFFFPLELGDPLVNCIELLVIHFGRFEELLYLGMLGFDFGDTRLGCLTQWFAVKPCLHEFLAVRPGRAFGEQGNNRADAAFLGMDGCGLLQQRTGKVDSKITIEPFSSFDFGEQVPCDAPTCLYIGVFTNEESNRM